MAASPVASHLLKLPAELRNYIYELAFTSNHVQSVRLAEVSPPLKALPKVSRQIYNESRLIYRDAYRKFWTDNKFTVMVPQVDELKIIKDHIAQLDEDALQHIEDLEITVMFNYGNFENPMRRLKLVDSRGVWHSESFENGRRLGQYYPTIVKSQSGEGYCLWHMSAGVQQAKAVISRVVTPASIRLQIIQVLKYYEWL